MKLLGIDYGRKKIGLAIADGPLAEPFLVTKVKSQKEATEKVAIVVEEEQIEKIILGLSEGKMAEETKKFGKKLENELEIPIEYQDETLTSHEAQELSIKAGIGRKKRKSLEDAYSATLILQSYIDNL